jgi:hypothetical protein
MAAEAVSRRVGASGGVQEAIETLRKWQKRFEACKARQRLPDTWS